MQGLFIHFSLRSTIEFSHSRIQPADASRKPGVRHPGCIGSPMTSNIARKVVQSFRQTAASVTPGEELSPREQEVLDLLARGYLYKEIAERLNISVPTVNTYVRRMYEKLHVRSRAQAVAKYAHLGPDDEHPAAPARAA
jgi:DNA-binding CsgD family transcriptional regulator